MSEIRHDYLASKTWRKTLEMRVLVTFKGREALQQAWQCIETGEIEWKDVPKVNEAFADARERAAERALTKQ